MFGFRNFTGFGFVGKIGKFGVEFTAGVIEKITLNITASAASNATEIPDNLNLNLISKDQFITTTSIAVSSKIVESNIFGLITGAKPNLFI
jgi:hypothetical protein